LSFCLVLLVAFPAAAQDPQQTAPAPSGQQPGGLGILAAALEARGGAQEVSANHWRIVNRVDIPIQPGVRIFADEVDLFIDTGRLVAAGNVAFTNPEGLISAERLEYNFNDGTAMFDQAVGIVSLGPLADRSAFANQEPDVYFYGEKIEKLGPKKYRITRGGFSTCVQPTPRWEVTSKSIVLNLDDYALATGTTLRVKGVPLLYLPAIYYPLEEDQRSTGFLLPTYGTSTLRGSSLSNAFFWAIGRSHDATFFHDWFTRAGQGAGAEYRYIANAGSSGEFRLYRFNQRSAEFTSDSGQVTALQPATSYEVRGSVVHQLAPGLIARGRAEYASDLVTQQLYQQNVYRASNPIRLIESSVSGAWGPFSLNGLYNRTEVFSSVTQSTLSGSTPRVSGAIAQTPLFGLPVYGSMTSEYSYLPYRSTTDGRVTSDNSMAKFEIAPALRVPLSTLTFLTVNSTAAYRTTYFSRSLDARGNTVAEPVGRSYLGLRSDIVGPVFSKIWDTPASTATERMKHVIEPTFSVDYATNFSNAGRLPPLSYNSDVVIGGSMRLTYGLTNRLFSRARATGTTRGSSREFLTIRLQQTYYSEAEASKYDYEYTGSTSRTRLADLSPVALTTSFTPSPAVTANGRLEYDVSGLGLQTITLGGSVNAAANSTSVSYSRVIYSPAYRTNSLTLSNSMRFLDDRATGTYSLSWDLARSYIVSQSLTAAYLAQCCGVQVEYQQFNYPDIASFPVSADRRLNFGFVLAGLGTFSNFFGAFGGQP
jgi:LPS-assembly protein